MFTGRLALLFIRGFRKSCGYRNIPVENIVHRSEAETLDSVLRANIIFKGGRSKVLNNDVHPYSKPHISINHERPTLLTCSSLA